MESSRRTGSENNAPERSESSTRERESGRNLSNETFGKPGDQSALDAMNTHTRGGLNGGQLEFTNPYQTASSDMQFLPPAQQQPGAGPAQEVAGRPPSGNGNGRQDVPEQLRQIQGPSTDPKVLEQGVVKITPTFPGTGRYSPAGDKEGSGFLVNTRGDAGPSRPGEQLVTTSDHVIEDRQNEIYKMGGNLFEKKGDLSKADLATRGNEVLSGIDDTKANPASKSDRDYARDQLQYIQQNFDSIHKVSAQLDPNAKGITKDGLDEYRRENTKIDVETQAGHFDGQIANRNPNSDVAVVRIGNLSQDQQQRIGPNREFEYQQQMYMGEDVKSIGYKKTIDSKIAGVDQKSSLGDRAESVVVDKQLESGMSGGPTLDGDFKVVGINHAKDKQGGFFTPIREASPLLNEIAQGKVQFRRNIH